MRNTVYTIGQYMMQGFTAEEAVLMRKHDIMFNNWENLTEEEKEEFWEIQEKLGL